MAWADITYPEVNELTAEAALDIVRGNIEALHTPVFDEYQHPGTGGDYTVTGDLGQDIDSTNFSLSLTTTSARTLVVAMFNGQFKNSGTSSTRVNIIRIDPISYVGRNLYNDFAIEVGTAATAGHFYSIIKSFLVSAGTHQFRAVWGNSGGTGTLLVVNRPWMCVRAWR